MRRSALWVLTSESSTKLQRSFTTNTVSAQHCAGHIERDRYRCLAPAATSLRLLAAYTELRLMSFENEGAVGAAEAEAVGHECV